MSYKYTRSESADFPSGIIISQFIQECATDIPDNLINKIEQNEDVIDMYFDSEITDFTTLNNTISNHVPKTIMSKPEFFILPNTDTVVLSSNKYYDSAEQYIKLKARHVLEVYITPNPVNKFDCATLTEALSLYNNDFVIYTVYPGTYYETNPLTLPYGSTLVSGGSVGNTYLVATNPNADLLILNKWCTIKGITFVGAAGPGSRGIYFDGTNESGNYKMSLIKECAIYNCNIGIQIENAGSHIISSMLNIMADIPVDKGAYLNNGGSMFSFELYVTGLTGTSNINTGILCTGSFSKLVATNSGVWYMTNGIVVDDNAEIDMTQILSYSNVDVFKVGDQGTSTIANVNGLKIIESSGYDIQILPTLCRAKFSACDMTCMKIYNPNNIKYSLNSNHYCDNKNSSIMYGDVRIGSYSQNSSTNIGEGKYNYDIIVLSNDNNEVGTFVDLTSVARFGDDTSFNIFQTTAANNCCFVGFDNTEIGGIKIHMTTALADILYDDVVIEYWYNSTWNDATFMITYSDTYPYLQYEENLLKEVEKYHVRFDNNIQFSSKDINGNTKNWIRFRVVNTLSGIPQAEYIKVINNSIKINKNGYCMLFGKARKEKLKNLGIKTSNQTLYIDNKMTIPGCSLANNDTVYYNIVPQKDIDISCPLILYIEYIIDNATSGTANLDVYYCKRKIDDNIYINSGDATGTLYTLVSNSITINTNDNDKKKTDSVNLSLDRIYSNSGNDYSLIINIQRNDTYIGNIVITNIYYKYTSFI